MKAIPFILFTCLFVLCFGQNAEAQRDNAQISGVILNPAKEPAMYSTVILLNEDSVLVKGAFSQQDGSFLIDNVAPGKYFIFIRNIEFKHWISDTLLLARDEKKVLNTITLQYGTNQLQEVVVSADKAFVETKVDRMVLNIASLTNPGGNALEVLERSPGIIINRFSKTISLFGKDGVVVMINGKISRMSQDAVVQMLEGMNLANIERIELIHTPPANFEAEGNAGILNIVLKKNVDFGLNGSYSLNGGVGADYKYGGGINFNYRKGIMNLYGGYDHNYDLNPQTFTNYRGVYNSLDFLETDTRSSRMHTPTTVQNARVGVDLELSDKTVLGVLGSFFDRDWYMEAVSNTTFKRNGFVESLIMMPNSETNHNRSVSGNINLNHKFSDRYSFNVDADFIHYEMFNPSDYEIRSGVGSLIPEYNLSIDKKTPIDIGVVKLDYVINVNPKVSFEAGAKYTLMSFDNTMQVDSFPSSGLTRMVMQEYTSTSFLDENVAGYYVSFSANPGKKTELKGGLRYEYTNTNLGTVLQPDIVDRHYGTFFPSLFLTHRFTDTQNVNVSYSKRISRPQITHLAPFYVFTDPSTVLTGNPALQPAIVNAVRVDYGFKTWRTAVSYSVEEGSRGWIPVIDALRNRQLNTIQNFKNAKVFSAFLYVPVKITSWWEVINNANVNQIESNLTIDGLDITHDRVSWTFNSASTFKLPEGVILELRGNYNSPVKMGVIEWSATGDIHLGLQKDFGSSWGKLRFNVSNLLETGDWYGKTRLPENNLLVDVSFLFSERVYMISWTNTFGSDKVKAARNRQTGATEERQRL
jgi:hypothetical protein